MRRTYRLSLYDRIPGCVQVKLSLTLNRIKRQVIGHNKGHGGVGPWRPKRRTTH